LTPTGATGAPSTNLTAVYLVLGVLLVGAIAIVVYLMARQRAAQEVVDDVSGRDAKSARRRGTDKVAPRSASKPGESDDDPFDIEFDEK
jgi:Flp pilus assembly protein protease CpaA